MRRYGNTTWQRLRLLLTLVAVAAFLFLLPARFTAPLRVAFDEAVGPAQTVVYQTGGKAVATTGSLTDAIFGADRQRALERELNRLENERAALAEIVRRQKMRLNSIDKLQVKRFAFRTLRAPVSSYDTSAVRRAIGVRAGTRDGVESGFAVSADGALVGVVTQVGPWQCRVRLITDAESAIPCRLSTGRSVCILQGEGEATCTVDWVDREQFVEPGDVVVTASLELTRKLRLPDGLPVATISAVKRDGMRPLFLEVSAEPRVNLERLEEVEILIPEGDRAE